MRESVGGLSLMLIIVALIIIFTGVVTFTVNRSNSFAIKDEIVSIIESDNGFNMNAYYNYDTGVGDKTLKKIVETISDYEYRQTGKCTDLCVGSDDPGICSASVEYACFSRNGSKVSEGEDASLIIYKKKGSQGGSLGTTEPYYFEVRVFYRIDLPILNNILIFSVNGQTKPMYTGATTH